MDRGTTGDTPFVHAHRILALGAAIVLAWLAWMAFSYGSFQAKEQARAARAAHWQAVAQAQPNAQQARMVRYIGSRLMAGWCATPGDGHADQVSPMSLDPIEHERHLAWAEERCLERVREDLLVRDHAREMAALGQALNPTP